MTYEILIGLAVFALVSSLTPGPNNLMLMASGANFGFRIFVFFFNCVQVSFAYRFLRRTSSIRRTSIMRGLDRGDFTHTNGRQIAVTRSGIPAPDARNCARTGWFAGSVAASLHQRNDGNS